MQKRKFSIFRRGRRFKADESGSMVVEFALISIPFLGCLFAIMEIGLVFFAGQVLETAVGDASRLILTGQAQSGNFDATAFKNQICTPSVQALFKCDGIKLDVRTVNSWSSADLSKPVKTTTDPVTGKTTTAVDTSNFTYSPGGICQIVVVRVVYEWPTFVRHLGLDLATLSDGNHLLMSTTAFRNEPYSGSGFCGTAS